MSAINVPAELEQIARQHLRMDTLQVRKCDRLDFYDVAVWTVEAALQEAFKLGQQNPTAKL